MGPEPNLSISFRDLIFALALALPLSPALAQAPTETTLTRSPEATVVGDELSLSALVDPLGQRDQ